MQSVGCSGSLPQLGCGLLVGVHTCLSCLDEGTQKYHVDYLHPVLMLFSLLWSERSLSFSDFKNVRHSQIWPEFTQVCFCGDH